jgi:hypothetical protein
VNVYRVRLTRKIVKEQTVTVEVRAETPIRARHAAVGQALYDPSLWDGVSTGDSNTYKPVAENVILIGPQK